MTTTPDSISLPAWKIRGNQKRKTDVRLKVQDGLILKCDGVIVTVEKSDRR